ncbi:hypothetical protein [Bosea sp. (in: a-proteobacteria)]|uniref:hypothetical protein n=1 Tax=Bosea sp. (in: a-proteobacteria) TaxID=1871050 RepID=UPI003B3A5FBD
MNVRDIAAAIAADDRPAMRSAFCNLTEGRGRDIKASAPGFLVVALNRLTVALADDAAEMPPGACEALGLPASSSYADGAARAKRESARLAGHLMAQRGNGCRPVG